MNTEYAKQCLRLGLNGGDGYSFNNLEIFF